MRTAASLPADAWWTNRRRGALRCKAAVEPLQLVAAVPVRCLRSAHRSASEGPNFCDAKRKQWTERSGRSTTKQAPRQRSGWLERSEAVFCLLSAAWGFIGWGLCWLRGGAGPGRRGPTYISGVPPFCWKCVLTFVRWGALSCSTRDRQGLRHATGLRSHAPLVKRSNTEVPRRRLPSRRSLQLDRWASKELNGGTRYSPADARLRDRRALQ